MRQGLEKPVSLTWFTKWDTARSVRQLGEGRFWGLVMLKFPILTKHVSPLSPPWST